MRTYVAGGACGGYTIGVARQRSVSKEQQAARLERRMAALALRPSLSPAGPAPERLRVATWNLNSLRARLAGVERFLERVAPDVVCLQETKAAWIDHTERGCERPSDHAALIADFHRAPAVGGWA